MDMGMDMTTKGKEIKKKKYAPPSLTVKRIHRHWRHSSPNWIQMIHVESRVVIRLSVGMHRITAWRKKWNKHVDEYGVRAPAQGKKIPLDTVIQHIGGLGIEGFACYCNNKILPDCNPLDAAYYVLVIERELHRSTIPWMPLPVMSDIRDVKKGMDHVSNVVDAMDSLRESNPKAAREHDDSLLERAERRRRQRMMRRTIQHVEEEPPKPSTEQDQEPTTKPADEQVPPREESAGTAKTPETQQGEKEKDRRNRAIRNKRFSEILDMARNKL